MTNIENRIPPLPGQVYQTIEEFDSYDAQVGRFDTLDPEEAHVTTSKVADKEGWHKLVIDLDLPAKLIPSSTPGHFHLYVDKEIPDNDFWPLLRALDRAGLIEPGYRRASEARGFTAVRMPWVKKDEAQQRVRESFLEPEAVPFA